MENAQVLGLLGNGLGDENDIIKGILRRYPYLTQGTNANFYPGQAQAIGNQLYKGFGNAPNTPADFINRVQGVFTNYEGGGTVSDGGSTDGGGDPTGYWAVQTMPGGEGKPQVWSSGPNTNAGTAGATWFGTGNPYSNANWNANSKYSADKGRLATKG